MKRAHFISLDGIDGAGKSTQLERLRQWYAAKDLPVHFTREIGGSELGERLRTLILQAELNLDWRSELLLIFAARREHCIKRIQPHLSRGISVVCDRFSDASYAYQGAAGGEALQAEIAALERWTLGDFRPHLSFIFLLELEEAQRRRQQRAQQPDRMESRSEDFYRRVAEIYRRRSRLPGHVPIDAGQDEAGVFRQLSRHLEALYE